MKHRYLINAIAETDSCVVLNDDRSRQVISCSASLPQQGALLGRLALAHLELYEFCCFSEITLISLVFCAGLQ